MNLSYNEFKRLRELFWPEIEEELKVWIDQLRLILEDPESETTLKDIHQAQGSLRAIRNVISLPDVILEQKQTTEMEEEDESARAREEQ